MNARNKSFLLKGNPPFFIFYFRDSPNDTFGNFTNGTTGSQWYHWLPENPEGFSVANGTIGANDTIGQNIGTNGTVGSPNSTIGKPSVVNSNI